MSDIANRLRESAKAARAIDRSALLEEAAGEIEKLSRLVRFQDRVIRSGDVAALASDEREAIEIAMHRCDTPQYKSLRGLLERLR